VNVSAPAPVVTVTRVVAPAAQVFGESVTVESPLVTIAVLPAGITILIVPEVVQVMVLAPGFKAKGLSVKTPETVVAVQVPVGSRLPEAVRSSPEAIFFLVVNEDGKP
jgi:hypothetical protein